MNRKNNDTLLKVLHSRSHKEAKEIRCASGGIKYEGEWSDDRIHGNGTFCYSDREKYEGNHFDKYEKWQKKFLNSDFIVLGKFRDGKRFGNGTLFKETHNKELEKYEGNWSDNQLVTGIYYKNSRKSYEGSFKDEMYNGNGTMYNELGNLAFKGQFLNSKKNGFGTEYTLGRVSYEGK